NARLGAGGGPCTRPGHSRGACTPSVDTTAAIATKRSEMSGVTLVKGREARPRHARKAHRWRQYPALEGQRSGLPAAARRAAGPTYSGDHSRLGSVVAHGD